MKLSRIILLGVFVASLFQACRFFKIPKLAKQGEVNQTDFLKEVPFDFSQKLILIDVVINGRTYNFGFDTGADLSVFGEHMVEDMDYKVVASSKVNATQGRSKNKMKFVEIPSMVIGGVDFQNTGAIISDLSHFDQYFGCKPVDGILGSNMIRKAAWQIDYQNEQLRLADNAQKFSLSEGAIEWNMDAGEFRSVYFDLVIDSVPARFGFDTGSSGFLSADSSLFRLLEAKNPDLAYTTERGITSSDLLGVNSGKLYHVLANSIEIEGMQVKNQVFSMSANGKRLIGNQFFENYTLTIDWWNDKLFLDPIKETLPDTLRGHEFDFKPNFSSMKIEIRRFRDDHPLEEPIAMDAEILEINGVDVSQFTLEELCAYWGAEGDQLMDAESIDMVVMDQGMRKTIVLTERIFLPRSGGLH